MTREQWIASTEALLAMAKKGVLAPRVPQIPLELLTDALKFIKGEQA